MKAADIFSESTKRSRQYINPPYPLKDVFVLVGITIILLAIPLTVISVYQAREPNSQAASEDKITKISRLTNELRSRTKTYAASKKTNLVPKLHSVASERKKLLLQIIETNPEAVLDNTLPSNLQTNLPSSVQALIEKRVDIKGTLEIVHKDDFVNKKTKTKLLLNTTKERLSLHSSDALPPFRSGDKVRVSGVRIDKKIAFSTQKTIEVIKPANLVSIGQQRVAVILANFQDDTSQPVTKNQVQDILSNQVDPFYQEASYNKLSLPADVFGWYTLPIDFACDLGAIRLEALKAADTDINFQNYRHIIYAIPNLGVCGWGGIAGGEGTFPSLTIPYTSDDGVITVTHAWMGVPNTINVAHITAHELGHNIGGIKEAYGWDCENDIIGPLASEGGGNCTSIIYGDLFDVMGSAKLGHFNAYHKEKMGWFDPSNIITVANDGIYTIEPLETATAGPKIIKIPRDKNNAGEALSWLYLEFRQLIGFDADELWMTFSSNPTNGVLIRYPFPLISGDSVFGYTSLLLDATPESQSSEVYDRSDSALEVGKTFSDTAAGITITTLSKTNDNISVQITVGQPLGNTGDLNGDGKVNIFDASIMTSKWGTNDPTADLNGDGTVNIFDASILTANWTG